MNGLKTACALGVLLVAPGVAAEGAAPELGDVLKKLGEQMSAGTATDCSFVEKTLVEELDKNRKPTAREVHTYRVEMSNGEVKRTFVGSTKELGELSSKLRPKPDKELSAEEKERRRKWRTPFHSEEQAKYRFKWVRPPENGKGTIAFEPLERHVEKGTGVVTVEVESGRLLSFESKPSKFPVYLSEMDARMRYANTPCGLQMTRAEMTGEGGILFVRMRFHSVTELLEHAKKGP